MAMDPALEAQIAAYKAQTGYTTADAPYVAPAYDPYAYSAPAPYVPSLDDGAQIVSDLGVRQTAKDANDLAVNNYIAQQGAAGKEFTRIDPDSALLPSGMPISYGGLTGPESQVAQVYHLTDNTGGKTAFAPVANGGDMSYRLLDKGTGKVLYSGSDPAALTEISNQFTEMSKASGGKANFAVQNVVPTATGDAWSTIAESSPEDNTWKYIIGGAALVGAASLALPYLAAASSASAGGAAGTAGAAGGAAGSTAGALGAGTAAGTLGAGTTAGALGTAGLTAASLAPEIVVTGALGGGLGTLGTTALAGGALAGGTA
ncbi:MAG: hypothetical protein WCI05_15260, partial [Myxococcales bacterium]